MIPLALPIGGPLSPVLFLRPSASVVSALSTSIAAKAPCVAALAPRASGGGGPPAIDAAGVSDAQRYEVRLRWVAHRLRQRYGRHRSYAGVRALCSANDLLLAAVAVSMALRVAGFCAAMAASASVLNR